MKRIIMIVLMLLLVGCSNKETIDYKLENNNLRDQIRVLEDRNRLLEDKVRELNKSNEHSLQTISEHETQIQVLTDDLLISKEREVTYIDSINSFRNMYNDMMTEWNDLSKEEKIMSAYTHSMVNLMHIQPDEEYIFFDKKKIIRIAPLDSSPMVAETSIGTLAEVIEMCSVGHQEASGIWYYVSIPNYAEPMNSRGWIRKEDVLNYNEVEKEAIKNIAIERGSEVYHVWAFEDIDKKKVEIVDYEVQAWIEKRNEGYVLLTLPGGDFGWTKEENLVYPKYNE